MIKNAAMVAALCGALFASAADAAIISGTWNFSAAGGITGSFSFTGFDTSIFYTGSTAAGFTVSTNFATAGDGGNAFDYDPGIHQLVIGGLNDGVHSVISPPATNDWALSINGFPTSFDFLSFSYAPISGSFVFDNRTVTVAAAAATPEPATLALLGVGLAGIGFARRRARQAA